jgi:hypothetical protein
MRCSEKRDQSRTWIVIKELMPIKNDLMSSDYEINPKTLANTVDDFLAKSAPNATTVGTEEMNIDVRISPEKVDCQLIAIC